MACGAAPVVVTWLHAYSDTPHRHPQPSYELTLVTAALGVLTTLVARLLHCRLGGSWLAIAGLALADGFLQAGLARCQEPDFDLWRLLLFGYRACIRLEQGRTDEAVESAAIEAGDPRSSPLPRILGKVVIGLAGARRGDRGCERCSPRRWRLPLRAESSSVSRRRRRQRQRPRCWPATPTA